jgi:DNA-binding response OmpR family regulator
MPKKILVVDDDQGIIEVIKIILEDSGYEVVTTSDGTAVQQIVRRILPDAVLLDLWMSGLDGHYVCKQLKKMNKTKNIPIIVVSALNDGEQKAKLAGADDFLSKPFNINDLVAIVEKHLKN